MTAEEGSDLRRRTATKTGGDAAASATLSNVARKVKENDEPFITFIDILRILGGIVLASTLTSYLWTGGESFVWGASRPWWTKPARVQQWMKPPLLLTNEELAAYDGSDPSKPILLALNRTIYDVSASPQVYGVGGMYSTLAAKDASRSYITTCFDPVDDLVPYLGGVEEVYVPLWLSRNSNQEELDEIASGEIVGGLGLGGMIETIQKRVGRRKTRKLQDEAYAKARERVAAQIKTWEGMFAKKDYPVVGRVIGVVEDDPKLWKKLKFCDKARKQRPSMAESLGEAMKAVTGSDKVDIGKMKQNMAKGAKAAGLDLGDKLGKKKKNKKAKKESEESASEKEEITIEEAAAAAVGGSPDKKTEADLQGNADASIADMMKGGKFAPESKERAEKDAKKKQKGDL